MIIDLGDPGLEVFYTVFGVAGSYWVYRCPSFFATWFWLKRYFPTQSESERIPPTKFVRFFQILGMIGIWGYPIGLLVYCALWVTGVGVINYQPPAI